MRDDRGDAGVELVSSFFERPFAITVSISIFRQERVRVFIF